MVNVLVGCCGWAVKGGRRAYYGKFKTVELQDTFYNLPKIETVEKLRREAPSGFVFCMKAWQAITHPPTSPTWRRARTKIPKTKQKNYGNLMPTRENLEAWNKTLEVAEALGAEVIIIQTPASFGYTEQNFRNASEFFQQISTNKVTVGWEPRGSWRDNHDKVKNICEENNLVHVVDPFRWHPLDGCSMFYLRLHGIGRGEVNYSYKYTEEDLLLLRDKVLSLLGKKERGYVMFNNISMAVDAERLLSLL